MGYEYDEVPSIEKLRAQFYSRQVETTEMPAQKPHIKSNPKQVPEFPETQINILKTYLNSPVNLVHTDNGSGYLIKGTKMDLKSAVIAQEIIDIVKSLMVQGNSALELINKYGFSEEEAGLIFTIYCNNLREG